MEKAVVIVAERLKGMHDGNKINGSRLEFSRPNSEVSSKASYIHCCFSQLNGDQPMDKAKCATKQRKRTKNYGRQFWKQTRFNIN
jgi:hypothetical protein